MIDESLEPHVVDGCLNILRDLSGFGALELVELRRGHVKVAFPTKPGMSNPQGNLHGGFFMAVADMVGCMASYSCGRLPVTLQAHFDFCKGIPIDGGRVNFTADVAHNGRTIQVVDILACNERGEMCLHGSLTTFAKDQVRENNGFPDIEGTRAIIDARLSAAEGAPSQEGASQDR